MAKIGRPKGAKTRPKWLREALAAQAPKRGRGRPPGSKNKPKTVEGIVAEIITTPLEPPKLPPKKRNPKLYNGKVNDISPEARSERARKAGLARAAKAREEGLPQSLPKGWTLQHFLVANEVTKQETKRILEIMADAGVLPEDPAAQEAMAQVLTIMRGSQSLDMKLKAARTVLEYTKAKPTAKHDHTIRTAEDFLDDLAKETESDPDAS